jgi:anti-anti-sigma regulatory factor
MSILRGSQDVILQDLPRELENHSELQTVIGMVRDRGDCDVVGGACLAGLLEMRRLLIDCGHKLTLCSVAPATKGVFIIARLDDLFEFAEDRVGLHPINKDQPRAYHTWWACVGTIQD